MNTIDRWISGADQALRTLTGSLHAGRPNPADAVDAEPPALTAPERRRAAALMRVDHVGEVCAQALYHAQALASGNAALRERFSRAAREEADHLAWTQQRLAELGARPSLLNPLWYAGAFGIGLVAGHLGDSTSLAFVVETERQVEEHLAGHLDRLPAGDLRSRRIVEQMKIDERRHADEAEAAGAARLPLPARWLMRGAAKVMTVTAARV